MSAVERMHKTYTLYDMIQICSGITSGRVLNGELYAQRLEKLIYLHLLTGCFMRFLFNPWSKISQNPHFAVRIEEKSS